MMKMTLLLVVALFSLVDAGSFKGDFMFPQSDSGPIGSFEVTAFSEGDRIWFDGVLRGAGGGHDRWFGFGFPVGSHEMILTDANIIKPIDGTITQYDLDGKTAAQVTPDAQDNLDDRYFMDDGIDIHFGFSRLLDTGDHTDKILKPFGWLDIVYAVGDGPGPSAAHWDRGFGGMELKRGPKDECFESHGVFVGSGLAPFVPSFDSLDCCGLCLAAKVAHNNCSAWQFHMGGSRCYMFGGAGNIKHNTGYMYGVV